MKMNKTFDCQEMVLRIQEEIADDIAELSTEERLRQQRRTIETGPFAERWLKPRKVSQQQPPAEAKAVRPKKKTFDCVEMKHRIQEEIAKETEGMSHEERLAYSRRNLEQGPFAELWKRKSSAI